MGLVKVEKNPDCRIKVLAPGHWKMIRILLSNHCWDEEMGGVTN